MYFLILYVVKIKDLLKISEHGVEIKNALYCVTKDYYTDKSTRTLTSDLSDVH